MFPCSHAHMQSPFLAHLGSTSSEICLGLGSPLKMARSSLGVKSSAGFLEQTHNISVCCSLSLQRQCAVKLLVEGAGDMHCHVAGGSGSAYIYGFCDRNWRPGMSEADCEAFVKKAVGLALSRDGSSGGCIRTVVITKDGVRRSFLPNDKVNFLLVFCQARMCSILSGSQNHRFPCVV